MDKRDNSLRTRMEKLKPILNFWPAALVLALVVQGVSSNVPVLQDIPALLEMVEAASTDSSEGGIKTRDKSDSAEKADSSAKKLEDSGATYTDGVYTGSAQGFGGTVSVQVTVSGGKITDIQILDASGETDSFFSKATGVIDEVLQAQTWDVDVISGATYSSRGILGAIQNALTGETVENESPDESSSESGGTIESDVFETPSGGYTDGTYTGTATGFGGNITVSVTISGGQITDISVLDASGESSEYFNNATAVISWILSAQSPNVDTVSGATYSSNGIINAVKRALSQAAGSSTAGTSTLPSTTVNTKTDSENSLIKTDVPDPDTEYADGTYTGTADGFGGDVTVSVTITDGKISAIELVSAEDETEQFLTKAKAVLTEMLEKNSTDVDTVTGATYSSNGMIEAARAALKQSAEKKAQETGTDTSDTDDTKTDEKDSVDQDTDNKDTDNTDTDKDSDASSEEDTEGQVYKNGTFTGTGEGFGGDIVVGVTIKTDKITALEIISAENETKAFLTKAENLLPVILEKGSTDVDTISGATYSSEGILEAVEDALDQSKAALEEEKKAESEEKTDSESTEDEDKKDDSESTEDEDKKDDSESTEDEDKKDDSESTEDEDKKDDSESTEDEDKKDDSESTEDEEQKDDSESTEDEEQEEDSGSDESETETGPYVDGTYWGSTTCTDDDLFLYQLKITIDIENGYIKTVTADRLDDESDDPDMNQTYFLKAMNGNTKKGIYYVGLIDQLLEKQSADSLDIVSGATYSSNAAIESAKAALALAIPADSSSGEESDVTEEESADQASGKTEEESAAQASEKSEVTSADQNAVLTDNK